MNQLRVLEFQGLAPSVYCGQHFADLGAEVCIVARHEQLAFGMPIHENMMNRNKKCICLSLRSPNDISIIKHLLKETDIVIDSFRPGVLEKAGLGPKEIQTVNGKVILLRVAGYGQEGHLASRPGHDLNYIAVSGYLSKIGRNKPSFPNNYLADFAACSLGVYGTMVALLQRDRTGQGQVVDCSLMHGTRYLSLPLNGCVEEPYEIANQQDAEVVMSKQPKGGQSLSAKIVKMESLSMEATKFNYMEQGYIAPSSKGLGFQMTSPFARSLPSPTLPRRGQHTRKYLQGRGVPKELIDISMGLQPKL